LETVDQSDETVDEFECVNISVNNVTGLS